MATSGREVRAGGGVGFLMLAGRGGGAGRPEGTGEARGPAPGATGRMETPEGSEGSLAVLVLVLAGAGAGGLCLPTGGWSLLSITVYFWSVLAEKDRVVPTLTLRATLRGTLRRTALPPAEGFTRIDTWSVTGLLAGAWRDRRVRTTDQTTLAMYLTCLEAAPPPDTAPPPLLLEVEL